MHIRDTFFPERVIQLWNRLPREAMELLPLEVFKRCLDKVLRETV